VIKRFVLLIFALVILVQSTIQTVIAINWKINQTYLTEKYCINKDQPELKCNGNCYLAKQLKKYESDVTALNDKTSKKQAVIKDTSFDLLCEKVEYELIAFDFSNQINTNHFDYKNNYSFLESVDFFQPPCFA
jgi:hypothetical protein